MNSDLSDLHIRTLVRSFLTEPRADEVLSDSTWVDSRVSDYLAAISDLEPEDREQVNADFAATLAEELKHRYPADFQQDE